MTTILFAVALLAIGAAVLAEAERRVAEMYKDELTKVVQSMVDGEIQRRNDLDRAIEQAHVLEDAIAKEANR